jgi:hypothetical protein
VIREVALYLGVELVADLFRSIGLLVPRPPPTSRISHGQMQLQKSGRIKYDHPAGELFQSHSVQLGA